MTHSPLVHLQFVPCVYISKYKFRPLCYYRAIRALHARFLQ